MNFREYRVTPIFLLLEAEKYERAASYILRDVFKEEMHGLQPDQLNDIKNNLKVDIRDKYKSIREEYPAKVTLEQMHDIADKVYRDIYRSLPAVNN
jgi:hypothetical protein